MQSTLLQQASMLDNDAQIELVEAIWDGIVKRGATSPISPAQKAELDSRLSDYLKNPEAVSNWQDVKARAIANLTK